MLKNVVVMYSSEICCITAERVKSEKLNLVCVPTSFQVCVDYCKYCTNVNIVQSCTS